MSSSRITAASNTNQTFIGVASNDWVMNANTNQSVWIGTVNNANPTQSNYLVIGPTQTQTSNLKVLSQLDLTGAKVIGLTGINSNQAFSNIYNSNSYTSNSFNSNLTATGQINFTGATFTPNTIPSSAISGPVGVNSNQSFSNIYASNAAFESLTASNMQLGAVASSCVFIGSSSTVFGSVTANVTASNGAYSNLNTSNAYTSNLTITQTLTLAQGSVITGFNGVSSNQSFSNVYTSNVYASNAAFSNLTMGTLTSSRFTVGNYGTTLATPTVIAQVVGSNVTGSNAAFSNLKIGTQVFVDSNLNLSNVGNITANGIIYATSFSGNAATATTAANLSGTPNINVGSITSSNITNKGRILVRN